MDLTFNSQVYADYESYVDYLMQDLDSEFPPVQEYLADHLKVGGSGDCWKKFVGSWERDVNNTPDVKLPFSKLREKYVEFCYMWAEEALFSGEYEIIDGAEDPVECAQEQMRREFVRYTIRDNKEIHIEETKTPWNWYFEVTDEDADYVAECPEGFISVYDFFFTDHVQLELDTLIGSAVDSLRESMRINGVEIAKSKAVEQFNNDLNSIPSTDFRLTTVQQRMAEKYLGFQVYSKQKHHNINDHLFLELGRDFCRQYIARIFPHNLDLSSTIHVGATVVDIKRWWSHAGHEFDLAMKESKDMARVYVDMLKWTSSRFNPKNLPVLRSSHPTHIRAEFKTLPELIALNDNGPRKRIHYKSRPCRSYDIAHFPDCLYSITADQMYQMFDNWDVKVGYATLFIPDYLITGKFSNSDVYTLEKYLPGQEIVLQMFDILWPQILALSPILPLKGFASALHEAMRWLLTTGFEFFKRKAGDILKDAYPFEAMFGICLDAMKFAPIMSNLLDRLLPWFYDQVCRIRVAWKNGYMNGYDEKFSVWKQWVTERRIVGQDFCIDSEIVYRAGEMYVIKFWKSNGVNPITTCLTIPPNRRTCLVLDVASVYNRTLGKVLDLKYFEYNEADWWTLFNWAMDQPLESLSFSVVSTTLNQIRRGLGTGSRTLVEPMLCEDNQVSKVALACLMEVYNQKAMLTEIEENPELRDSYQLNIDRLTAYLLRGASIIATGGLIIPVWHLFKWLTVSNRFIEYVQFMTPPKQVEVQACFKELAEPSVSLVLSEIPEETELNLTGCLICDLQLLGKFSLDGNPRNGQCFHLHSHDADNKRAIGFSAEEAAALVIKLQTAQTQHTAWGAHKVAEAIRNLKHYYEANINGTTREVKIIPIIGGPGTGKSAVLRAMAAHLEDSGESVAIMVPFKDLTSDYTNCEVIGNGRRTFEVDTTFYSSTRINHRWLFVDEASAADWDIVKGTATFINADYIVLAGDTKQTNLRPEAGEGTPSMGDLPDMDYNSLPKHELVYNYRLDAWRTKMLNHKYGYSMVAKRSDMIPPKLITQEQFRELTVKPDKNMVFAHATAPVVFGVESTPGTDDNLSVRSAQGKTCRVAAVSASDLDHGTVMAPGMLNVSVSRSTHQTWYIAPADVEDVVPRLIAKELFFDTQESIDFISSLSWPSVPEIRAMETMTYNEKHIDSVLRQKKEKGELTISGKQWIAGDFQIEFTKPKIEIKPSSFFNTCPFDDVLKHYPNLQCPVDEYLWKLYEDDDAMGRPNIVTKYFRRVTSGKAELPLVDGKRMLKLNECMELLYNNGVNAIVYRKDTVHWVSPGIKRGANVDIALLLEGNHVSETPIRSVRVKFADVDNVVEEQPNYLHQGKSVLDYPTSKGIYQMSRVVRVLITPEVTVGWNPVVKISGTKFENPKHQRMATEQMPHYSFWKKDPTPVPEKDVHTGDKLRFGTNMYLLKNFIDDSGAYVGSHRLNDEAPNFGQPEPTNVKLNWEGFLWTKTKAGKLRKHVQRKWYQMNPGRANHFEDGPVEAFVAAGRYGKLKPKVNLTQETRNYCHKLIDNEFPNHWIPQPIDELEENFIIDTALKAARQRNYHGRADAMKTFKPKAIFSAKAQVKPEKNGKLDLNKGGQGLMQTPPDFNLKWIAWARVANYRMKKWAKENYFIDDRENDLDFRVRLTNALRNGPEAGRFAVVDAKEFDSQQNEVTVYLERLLWMKFGFPEEQVHDFQEWRRTADFTCPSLFTGSINGDKGSGFLDTKSGNTGLETIAGSQLTTGYGEQIVSAKGDDYLKYQACIQQNLIGCAHVKGYLGLTQSVDIGDGAEFIGTSVTSTGMYKSVIRTARKVVAHHVRDKKHLEELQKSLRHTVYEWKQSGVRETIAVSADAEGSTQTYANLCAGFVESVSHITWEQYLQVAKSRKTLNFQLPTYEFCC